MFIRRYLEYPGRRTPGFLSLTFMCIGAFILVEVFLQYKSANETRIPEDDASPRQMNQIPMQIKERSQNEATVFNSLNVKNSLGDSVREDKFLSKTRNNGDANEEERRQRLIVENDRILHGTTASSGESSEVTSEGEKDSLLPSENSRPKKPRLLTMVIVLCSSNSENVTDDLFGIERQVRQARVSMKSAVYFSKDQIKLIVISNTETVFPKIQALVNSWPEEQRRKISLEFAPSFYPEKYKMMQEMFRPCSTQRLFLEQVLPNEDAILYVDTDVIFMRSPGDAWDLFDKFGEKQMIAAAGPSFMFIQRSADPDMKKFFEFEGRGFNAGILLFNLTRIRNSPHVWEFQILVSSKLVYFDQIMDQDILNFMCNQYPNYCFKLDCEWNFRWSFCANFSDRCPNILKNGPNIVHGIGGAFANPKHPKMVRMYEEFDKWNMSEPVSTLINTLQTILPNTTARTGHCSKIPGIDEALLKQLVISGSKV